ncbi:MAG: hypothetical protein DRN06_05650, partial [Thermoprotei archaeon]
EPPPTTIKLRDYQEEALRRLLESGRVLVLWPAGAGKTVFAAYCCALFRGPKLYLAYTAMAVRQFLEYLKRFCPEVADEVEAHTYAWVSRAGEALGKKRYSLVIFDEVHHLPAPTYAQAYFIRRKYQLAMTATPWREDGKDELIVALGGFPVGAEWEEFWRRGVVRKPKAVVYVVDSEAHKLQLLDRLVRTRPKGKKTIIFCDWLEEGKRLAERYGCPFIHGDLSVSKRFRLLEGSDLVVMSRVGDMAIHVPDVARVVEYGFLYGSRAQEGQRVGRLLHSEARGPVEHYVLMTVGEWERYRKRLHALYARDFDVEVVRL